MIFEIIFAVVTLLVAINAFKVFKLTNLQSPRLFATGFFLITLGYILQSSMNGLFFFYLKDLIYTPQAAYVVLTAYSVFTYGFMCLTLLGLITLVYMTFKIQKRRVYILLGLLALLTLMFTTNTLFMFYLFAAVLTSFLTYHYYMNFSEKPTFRTGLVLMGFFFLFLSNLKFLFFQQSSIFYFVGHSFSFMAYVLILANLLMVVHNGKKK